jgi:hypothetical protein
VTLKLKALNLQPSSRIIEVPDNKEILILLPTLEEASKCLVHLQQMYSIGVNTMPDPEPLSVAKDSMDSNQSSLVNRGARFSFFETFHEYPSTIYREFEALDKHILGPLNMNQISFIQQKIQIYHMLLSQRQQEMTGFMPMQQYHMMQPQALKAEPFQMSK